MDHAEYYFFRMWPAPFSLYISGQLLLQPVIHFNHPTKVEIKLLQMANFRRGLSAQAIRVLVLVLAAQ
jgi:hypothetical protein